MEKKISKTKIEKRLQGKTNPELVEAIIKLKKTNPAVAKLLAMPSKKWSKVNLDKIEEFGKDVVVAGKVLSMGDLSKKVRVVAWGFSGKAMEKIKKAGGEVVNLQNEILKNPELKGLEILR